jgi:hypothetical protein
MKRPPPSLQPESRSLPANHSTTTSTHLATIDVHSDEESGPEVVGTVGAIYAEGRAFDYEWAKRESRQLEALLTQPSSAPAIRVRL